MILGSCGLVPVGSCAKPPEDPDDGDEGIPNAFLATSSTFSAALETAFAPEPTRLPTDFAALQMVPHTGAAGAEEPPYPPLEPPEEPLSELPPDDCPLFHPLFDPPEEPLDPPEEPPLEPPLELPPVVYPPLLELGEVQLPPEEGESAYPLWR